MTEDGKLPNGNLRRGGGRPKGVPNKTTSILKDAILKAADNAGGKGGLTAYLTIQATENPGPFMSLLGKVLPLQINGPAEDGAHIVKIEADEAFQRLASRLGSVAGTAPGPAGGTDGA